MISVTACTPKPTTKPTPPKEQVISLTTITANDAPPEKRKTPIQSVMSQIIWELSNNEKIAASSNAILWNVTFGDESVVVTKVPKTSKIWYNIPLLKKKNNTWIIDGYIDFPVSTEEKTYNNKGLALPMNKFDTMNISLSNRYIWAFANDTRLVIISKSPNKSFVPQKNFTSVLLKKPGSHIKLDPNQCTLYYFDSNQLIWISGNISQSEIIALANSLPSITSPNFPYKN